MKVQGTRPRRVNLDGKSSTVLTTSAVDLRPGSLAHIENGLYVQSTTKRPDSRIVQCEDGVGGSILDPIKAGDSVEGDRMGGGRLYAALIKAGTVLKAEETLLKATATGELEEATGPFDDVVAVAIEDYTVPATPAFSHGKIRVL